MKNIFFILLVVLPVLSNAQVLKFSRAIEMNQNVNSDAEESAPFRIGGKLYFARSFHKDNVGGAYYGSDIWVCSPDENGLWQNAEKASPEWNNKGNNVIVGVSEDQKMVYLTNSYFKKSGICFSSYYKGKWTKPELIEIKGVDNEQIVSAFIAKKQNKILLSIKVEGTDHFDLYISNKISDLKYDRPTKLAVSINTSKNEISPFLSFDGKQLFFASEGHENFGSYDIFMSERLYNSWDVWSKPINLGKEINSKKFEGYFVMLPDSTAYFASNKYSKFAQLYKTNFKEFLIKDFDNIAEVKYNYLTDAEMEEALGFIFKPELIFEEQEKELSTKNRELIFFLANKLKSKARIVIILNTMGVVPEDQLELVKLEFLNLGIPAHRIIVQQPDEDIAETVVEIKFGNKKS